MGATSETGSATNFASLQLGGNGLGATGIGADSVIKGMRQYSQTITPASVAAATVAEQTFTVTGLTTADSVYVNAGAIANAVSIGNVRVSAADTMAVQFCNPTAGALVPTAVTWKIFAVRT